MESVRYTQCYLARAITANQNNLANDVLKLCLYSAKDGGVVSFNMTHAHMKNCSLRGVITRTDSIVKKKYLKCFKVIAVNSSIADRMQLCSLICCGNDF